MKNKFLSIICISTLSANLYAGLVTGKTYNITSQEDFKIASLNNILGGHTTEGTNVTIYKINNLFNEIDTDGNIVINEERTDIIKEIGIHLPIGSINTFNINGINKKLTISGIDPDTLAKSVYIGNTVADSIYFRNTGNHYLQDIKDKNKFYDFGAIGLTKSQNPTNVIKIVDSEINTFSFNNFYELNTDRSVLSNGEINLNLASLKDTTLENTKLNIDTLNANNLTIKTTDENDFNNVWTVTDIKVYNEAKGTNVNVSPGRHHVISIAAPSNTMDNYFTPMATNIGLSEIKPNVFIINGKGYKGWVFAQEDNYPIGEKQFGDYKNGKNGDIYNIGGSYSTPGAETIWTSKTTEDGKIIIDKKHEFYDIFKAKNIINENGELNLEILKANLLSIEDILAGNTNPNNPTNPTEPTEPSNPTDPNKSFSENIPNISNVINGKTLTLNALPKITIKNNPVSEVLAPNSKEEILYDAMYEKTTDANIKRDFFNEVLSIPKMDKINIKSTNITSESDIFTELSANKNINIFNSRIEGLDLRAGDFISNANNVYFQNAMKNDSSSINMVDVSFASGDIKTDNLNIKNVDIDSALVITNTLNANNLKLKNSFAFVYADGYGTNNTLEASKDILGTNSLYSAVFVKNAKDDYFKIGSTKAGLSTITPASVKATTKDGFKVFAIGSNEWVKSVLDTDGNVKLNAFALSLSENLDNTHFDENGKIKGAELIATLGDALESDGISVNLGKLGGVNNVEKITLDNTNINDLTNKTNPDGTSYAELNIDSPITKLDAYLEAKKININSDLSVNSILASKDSINEHIPFIDKNYGDINIAGKVDKLINISSKDIETNILNVENAVIKTNSLFVNKINAKNTTLDLTGDDSLVIVFDGANLNEIKFKLDNTKTTVLMIKNHTGTLQANQVAKLLKNAGSQEPKIINDGTNLIAIYNESLATDSNMKKLLETINKGNASIDGIALESAGLIETTKDADGKIITQFTAQATDEIKETLKENNIVTLNENGTIASVSNTTLFDSTNNVTKITLGDVKVSNEAIKLANTAINQAKFAYTLEINNMSKRLGEIRNLKGDSGFWFRGYTGKGSYKDYQDIKYFATTVGTDKYLDDETLVGLSFGYNKQKLSKDISGKQNSYIFTLYGTKMYESGLFFDGVLKYINSKGNYSNEIFGDMKGKAQNVFLASAELGYRAKFDDFFAEPSIELITGYIPENTLKSNEIDFKMKSYIPLNTKLSLNGGYQLNEDIIFKIGGGGIFELNNTKVNLKDTYGTNRSEKTSKDNRFFANIFGAYKLNDNTMLNLEAERTFNGDFNIDYNINFNLRYQF